MTKTYLDHAASTPMRKPALDMLMQASNVAFANPSSQHVMGQKVATKIEQARQFFLKTLNAEEDYKLVFTSSATEANNWVIQSLAPQYKAVLSSAADHPSVVAPVDSLPIEKHHYNLSEFAQQCRETRNTFVAATHVNSYSGEILDIAEARNLLADSCHLHVDAAQSFGKFPINLKESKPESLTITAHKMGGPRGVAALIYKKDLKLEPWLRGGPHENSMRASTPATALILSWAAALESDFNADWVKTQDLREQLLTRLQESHHEIETITEPAKTSPYITTVLTLEIPSDLIVRHLGEYGIAVSSSTACSSRSAGFIPAFAAIGIAEEHHKSVLRISMGHGTSSDEIAIFCQKLDEVLTHLSSRKIRS